MREDEGVKERGRETGVKETWKLKEGKQKEAETNQQ